ncbi:MAG TPA: cytochrome c biogenesis protein ResB, partial [Rectinemataceae bacterium]|nr:cytochrome c biogenesis protein ResB [Rectinemataceae bacterium]
MKSILGFFRSVRLAVVLIVYMAIFSLLASLIPQSQDRSFYAAHFPAPLAWIITGSGFSAFFRSPLFLVPAGLFFINLAVCTVDRFLRELKKQERRHGPDILHVGILLLCIGGLVSFEGRQSGSVLLSNGDAVRLSTDRVLEMTDFAYRAYPDGRPEDWTSTVRLYSGSKVEIPSYAIRVNHPLRLGLLSIYQVSHEIQRALVLQDSQGGVHSLAR